MTRRYNWVDNPCVSGQSPCETDTLNEDMMHLKYNAIAEIQEFAENTIEQVAGSVAIQRIYDSGISTDAVGYAKVYDLKHSSFDRSKLTVVGTPMITDDGVFEKSGLNAGDYVKIPLTLGNDWRIKLTVFCKSNGGLRLLGNTVAPQCLQIYMSSFGINARINNTVEGVVEVPQIGGSQNTIKNNTLYDIFLEYQNGRYTLGLKASDAQEYRTSSIESSTLSNGTELSVMAQTDANADYDVDLKQFSITVDGKEVFTPLTTGIDTVKPDDYTVVGTPTITDDGVVTNLNRGNYISLMKASTLYDKNWTIILKDLPLKQPDTALVYGVNFGSDITQGQLGVNKLAGSVEFRGFGAQRISYIVLGTLTDSDKVSVMLKYNKNTGEYALKYSINNGDWQGDRTYTPTDTDKNLIPTRDNNSYLRFGANTGGGFVAYDADFALNNIFVYIDDNLVYQPCLKIPYTQAKGEGVKVVNKEYWSRVQDWFEQSGEGNYLMIDEANQSFSLALPDVYSLIEQNSDKISQQSSLLLNKSDVDFSNATVEGKDRSVGWNLPDYSRRIVINSIPLAESPYTAPTKGVFAMLRQTYYGTHVAFINGVEQQAIGTYTSANTDWDANTLWIPLDENDTLYFSSDNNKGITGIAFYPMKGAL